MCPLMFDVVHREHFHCGRKGYSAISARIIPKGIPDIILINQVGDLMQWPIALLTTPPARHSWKTPRHLNLPLFPTPYLRQKSEIVITNPWIRQNYFSYLVLFLLNTYVSQSCFETESPSISSPWLNAKTLGLT